MPLSLFQLHGDLAELRFPRLLAALFQDHFTGVLQATCRDAALSSDASGEASDAAEITREVHLADGHIAWAISTDPDESLKAALLRAGTVTAQQWNEAEQNARDGSLREALISSGLVSNRELVQIEKGRVESIVLSLFAPRSGDYRIRERQLAPGTADLKLDPRPIILRGVPEWADRTLVLEEIGSMGAVYAVRRAAADDADLLLPQEFVALMRHLDGERTIADVIGTSSLPDHYVCSLFAALSLAGVIRLQAGKAPRPRAVAAAEAAEPPTQQTDIPAAPVAVAPPARQMELPPISTEPFPGEGPVTDLEIDAEASPDLEVDAEVAPELEVAAEEIFEPAVIVEPAREDDDFYDDLPAQTESEPELAFEAPPAPEPAASAYGAGTIPEASRPWFLLGGGAAVGIAALFLILMTQGPSESMEQPSVVTATPVAQVAPLQPGPDGAEDAAGADSSAVGPPSSPVSSRIAASSEPPPAASIRPRRPEPVVAARPAQPILRSDAPADATVQARRSLNAGDYAGAARQYSRAIRSVAPHYSVQIMAACQPETIRSIVQRARGSSQLFILPATLQGRDCYRVYWGRYRSYDSAQEALRRDVPATLRQTDAPRVARVGGA